MAITKMAEVSGQSLDYSRPFDSTSSRKWLAVASHNFHTSADVYQYGLDNSILPLPYVSYHPVLVGHSCRSVKVTQDDGAPRKWTIEAEYSSKPIKENESEENPLNRPARIRWRTASYQKAIWKDINDVPTFMLDYENAVNNAAITIGGVVIGQYEAKISDIEVSELKIEGDYQYFEFSYTLERRREKWIPLKVLDQGYRQIDPANSEKRIHIMDDSSVKRPVASLRLLDGAGKVLSDPTPERAKYRDFTWPDSLELCNSMPDLSRTSTSAAARRSTLTSSSTCIGRGPTSIWQSAGLQWPVKRSSTCARWRGPSASLRHSATIPAPRPA